MQISFCFLFALIFFQIKYNHAPLYRHSILFNLGSYPRFVFLRSLSPCYLSAERYYDKLYLSSRNSYFFLFPHVQSIQMPVFCSGRLHFWMCSFNPVQTWLILWTEFFKCSMRFSHANPVNVYPNVSFWSWC